MCLEYVETKDRFGASGPREQQCMMTSAFLQPQFLRHRIQSVQTQYIRCDGHNKYQIQQQKHIFEESLQKAQHGC